MTVSTETARSGPYAGNGVADTFAYEFRIQRDADLLVTQLDQAGVETALALGADYGVTGVDQPEGGEVVLAAPLPSGFQLVITRDVPATQEVDLENQGAFFAETIERAFDKLTMLAQQNKESDARTVTLPVVSQGVSTRLPGAVPDNVIGWNAAATALENKVPNTATYIGAERKSWLDTQGQAYWAGTAGGTANALTLAPSPAITTYAAGQVFRFLSGATANTGAATVAVSGQAAVALQLAGSGLSGGEVQPGRLYQIVYDGTAFQLDQSLSGSFSPLRGYISGLEMSNGVDTDHDLNVAAGVCTADDGSTSIRLTSALSDVPMDATFSEGAGGGMVTGDSMPVAGTVHLFLIDGGGKTPKLLGSSSTGSGLSPPLPSGFTVKRRIGSLATGSLANFVLFLQSGNSFRYVKSGSDANPQVVGETRAAVAVAVPRQIETKATFYAMCRRVGGTVGILLTALDREDEAAAAPRFSLATETAGGNAAGQFEIKTNTSGQIGVRSNASSTEVYLSITGWVDLTR